jgi:predicted ATPase
VVRTRIVAPNEGRESPFRTSEKVRALSAESILSLDSVKGPLRPMLASLTVAGLLSFGEPIEFVFGALNVLVGPNGSGKSNLFDCLRVLRNAPYDLQESFSEGGFEEWLHRGELRYGSASGGEQHYGSVGLVATLRLPQIAGNLRHEIRFGAPSQGRPPVEEKISGTLTDGAAEGELLLFLGSPRSGAVVSVPSTRARRREVALSPGEFNHFHSVLSQVRDYVQYPEVTRLANVYSGIKIYSEWTFGRHSKLREATPASRSDTVLSETMDDLALVLNGMERTPAHGRIREALGELKESYLDYVTRILFGRVGLELVEAPFELPIPASRLSDGTLRFLALAAILLQPDPPPVICIEEPELGMHPDMIRMVADMIVDASTRTQLLITTHSEHLLTALQDDFDALFTFGSVDASSFVQRFDQQQYRRWREMHSLGELWTSGELGGNRW